MKFILLANSISARFYIESLLSTFTIIYFTSKRILYTQLYQNEKRKFNINVYLYRIDWSTHRVLMIQSRLDLSIPLDRRGIRTGRRAAVLLRVSPVVGLRGDAALLLLLPVLPVLPSRPYQREDADGEEDEKNEEADSSDGRDYAHLRGVAHDEPQVRRVPAVLALDDERVEACVLALQIADLELRPVAIGHHLILDNGFQRQSLVLRTYAFTYCHGKRKIVRLSFYSCLFLMREIK